MMKRLFKIAITFGATACLTAQEPSLTDTAGNEMRLVREGHFVMGYVHYREKIGSWFGEDHIGGIQAQDEQPAHPVIITKPFYLAAREVSVGQFRRFVEETGYVTTAEKSGDGITGWLGDAASDRRNHGRKFERLAEFTWKNPGFDQTDDHPVVGVSWNDAKAYCDWLSVKEGATYRLPTEAEWEYACAAGSTTFFDFGDRHLGELNRHANYGDSTLEDAFAQTASLQWYVGGPEDGAVFTKEVGSYLPNAWGFHDMHGNVWELCQDFYHDTYFNRYRPKGDNRRPYGRDIDPVNLDEPWNDFGNWRVIKGGSWYVAPVLCRRSVRSYFEENDGACYIGFRVVREAEGPLVDRALEQHDRHEAARAAIEAIDTIDWWRAFNDDLTIRLRINQPPPDGIAEHLPFVRRVSAIEWSAHGQADPQVVAAIAKIPDLRSVRIYNPGLGVPAEAYDAFGQLKNLEEFIVNDNSTMTADQLASFGFLENLRLLGLGNRNLTSSSLGALAGRNFPYLEELQLQYIQSDGTGLAHFTGAPLRTLSLQALTDAGAREVGKFPTLESLSIYDPRISATGLAELASLSNLQRIRLSNLSEIADADFAPLEKMVSLISVELEDSGAGDLTAAILTNLPRLRGLRIGSPALTDEGMRHLGSIATLNETLDIAAEAQVTDAGLMHLWAPDRLNRLVLRPRHGITGRGFSSLAENLVGLRWVEIHSQDLTDEGLRYLGYLPNLEELKVIGTSDSGPPITDTGLLDLAEAPKLRKVEIHAVGLSITEAGIAAMKAKRPNLEVIVRS
tara:strand:+ start:3310 stop:5679 length:2370 start_codon:yes stop_codon:yes gene_type:complete